MIETKIEFTFSSGEFDKFRSTAVLKYLDDEVEEYADHFVIYQFLVLLWENNIIVSTW